MSEQNDGGPAFPGTHTVYLVDPDGKEPTQTIHKTHGGMSLRDYFAAQALRGLADHAAWTSEKVDQNARLAMTAYSLADSMLAQRAKVTP